MSKDSFIEGSRGVGYSFTGARNESSSVRADVTAYVDLSNFDIPNQNITLMVWARPVWYSTQKYARNYTVVGLSDDTNAGLFIKADDEATYNWVAAASSEGIILSSGSYPHDANDLIFLAITNGANSVRGFANIGNPSVFFIEALTLSPYAYYRLDEKSGTTIEDSTANARDGAYVGSPTLGEEGALILDSDRSVTLDGIDDYLQLNAGRIYQTDTSHSYAFWVKGQPQASKSVLTEWRSTSANPLVQFATSSGGDKLTVLIRDDANAVKLNATSAKTVFDGEWHFIVWTDNNGTATLYIDGQPDTTSFTYTRTTTTLDRMYAGASGTGQYFAGSIDEVTVYSAVLTAAQIQTLYDAGKNSRYFSTNNAILTPSDFTPTRLHLGGIGSTQFFDGFIEKVLLFPRVLTDEEIEDYAINGYNQPSDALVIVDFETLTAIVNAPLISGEMDYADSITMTEDTTQIDKVIWRKIRTS